MKKAIVAIIILAVIGVGFYVYKNKSSGGAVGAVKEFTITGQNFSFAPAVITVKKGDKVKITFKNAEGFHDFKIDEFNVATKQIQGGGEDTVEFTADKTGTFEYYCSVGKHRQMGMKGQLIVQ
jgi:cytochrome c oxidase subunit 2